MPGFLPRLMMQPRRPVVPPAPAPPPEGPFSELTADFTISFPDFGPADPPEGMYHWLFTLCPATGHPDNFYAAGIFVFAYCKNSVPTNQLFMMIEGAQADSIVDMPTEGQTLYVDVIRYRWQSTEEPFDWYMCIDVNFYSDATRLTLVGSLSGSQMLAFEGDDTWDYDRMYLTGKPASTTGEEKVTVVVDEVHVDGDPQDLTQWIEVDASALLTIDGDGFQVDYDDGLDVWLYVETVT